MRFALLSDIHLEFADYDLEFAPADYLLLAGDIKARYTTGVKNYGKFIKRAHEYYGVDKVLEIDGNHSGYGGSIIDFTHAQIVRREPGLTIIGCTLWSGQHSQFAYTKLNDTNIDGFTWDWMHNRHLSDLNFIKTNLEEAKKRGDKTVIFTHHLPHMDVVHERWGARMHASSPLNAPYDINLGFYTDLDWLIKQYKPTIWCFGHTHDGVHKMIRDTQMHCNPRGYPCGSGSFENETFNPYFTFTI